MTDLTNTIIIATLFTCVLGLGWTAFSLWTALKAAVDSVDECDIYIEELHKSIGDQHAAFRKDLAKQLHENEKLQDAMDIQDSTIEYLTNDLDAIRLDHSVLENSYNDLSEDYLELREALNASQQAHVPSNL